MSTYTFIYDGSSTTVPIFTTDVSQYTGVVIQDGFQIIPKFCFEYFVNLATCNLPDSITYIGDEAFVHTKITEIKIGPKAQIDPGNPFDGASLLQNITIDPRNPYYTVLDGVLYSKDMKILFSYPPANPMKNFLIPYGVERICGYSMKYINVLENIYIPSSVRIIGCEFALVRPNLKYTTAVYLKSKPSFECPEEYYDFISYSKEKLPTPICNCYMLHRGTYLLYTIVPIEV